MQIQSATVQSTVLAYETNTGGIASKQATLTLQKTDTYSNGTGINQADRVFSDDRTLAASGTETLDLQALVDDFGATMIPTGLVDIFITVVSVLATSILRVGGVGANAFIGPFGSIAGTQDVGPNGTFHNANPSAAGWTIDGTHHLLKILNLDGANAIEYKIVLIMRQ